MNVKPISEGDNRGCGTIFLVLFGSCFFLFAVFFLWMTAIAPQLRTMQSSDWIETPCTITTSKLKISRGEGTTYRPQIEFEYSVGEESYESDSYDFTELNRSKAKCKAIISAFPVGKQTSCYVNPQDSADAVIERSYDFSYIGTLLPVIFLLVGLGIMLSPLLPKSRSNSISGSAKASSDVLSSSLAASNFTGQAANASSSSHPADIEDANWDIPKTLKPTQRRTTTFVVTVLFAAFWNTIVVIMTYGIIKEGFGAGFSIFPTLFMIPFILVGLGLIVGVFYTLAAIFNPAVELAMSTGAIERGGSFDVAWQLSGRTSRVSSLKITVEGEESATYRRGTDTITDKNVFCKIPIAEVTDPQDIEFGSISATIPPDTMHTFVANRNKVTWRIVVHGDIPRWPDIKETYEFRVKP